MSELVVVPDKKMPNLYRVRYDKGLGQTPEYLEGLFSTRIAAKKRIMFYEARPQPEPIEYKHQKLISNEEEAELFEKAKMKAAEENAERENKNGKEEGKTTKNKG